MEQTTLISGAIGGLVVALGGITVSIINAFSLDKNNKMLRLRKLKKQHYISYIESLDNFMKNTADEIAKSKYTSSRNKLFVIGSEEVVRCILKYEKEVVRKSCEHHDEYLTDIIKAVRKDLHITDKCFPDIHFIK